MSASPLILIGAGSHAKVVADIARALSITISGYIDNEDKSWLCAPRIAEAAEGAQLVMGFVGLDCAALERRIGIMQDYQKQGATFPALIHPSAIVSPSAKIGEGVQILPGAIINSHAVIENGAVINSGAVVEHDAHIGAGAHVAPRAVVLGGAKVGACAYIGSGAVVVQNAAVDPGSFIKALSVRI